MSGIYWQFQANDNTRGGWLAFFLYLILIVLCWREVIRHYRPTGTSVTRQSLSVQFWIALSLFVTALGINKQLDLHSLIKELGRNVMSSEGLVQFSRWVNWGLVAVAACAGFLVAVYLWKCALRTRKAERLVVIGTAALAGFIFVRIASINHVELIWERIDRHRPMLALEILILLFLCIVTLRNSRSS